MTNTPVTPVVELKMIDRVLAEEGFEGTGPPYDFSTSNGGTSNWAPSTTDQYYGLKSLKSPTLSNGQFSDLNCTAPEGTTRFRLWCKTDCGASDALQILGLPVYTEYAIISGSTDWQQIEGELSGGQTLILRYNRVAGGGNNRVFVDQVQFLSDEWVDITDECRLESAHSGGGIRIKRGRPNESAIAEPTECDLVINNRSGQFSELNPAGPYYGLLGRNLPLRVALRRQTDPFNRTLSNQWGSMPNWTDSADEVHTGTAWTVNGTAANFDVTPGAATIQAATGRQFATTGTWGDVDVLVKVKVSNLTTGFGIVLREGASAQVSAYVLPGATDVTRIARSGTIIVTTISNNLGWDIVADVWYWVRAQATGRRYRIKVWEDGDPEPTTWNQTYVDDRSVDVEGPVPLYGAAGVYTRDGNALVTFALIEFNVWRAHTEVVSWPTKFDLSGQDSWVPLKTRGMLRRLGQGRRNLQSALMLHLQKYSSLSAMWYPLEEVGDTPTNAVPGGYTAVASGITAETPDSTGTSAFPGAAGVIRLSADSSVFTGAAINYTSSPTAWSQLVSFQLDSLPASEQLLVTYVSTGTGRIFRLYVRTDGAFRMDVYGSDGTIIDTDLGGGWTSALIPTGCWIVSALYVFDSGGTVTWAWNYHVPTVDTPFYTLNGSYSGTAGQFRSIGMRGTAALTAAGGLRLAQIMHYAGDFPFVTYQFADAAAAYQTETNIDRFSRLCEDFGITYSICGDTNTGHEMGIQTPSKLLDLLEECAEVGGYSLEEGRDALELILRTRESIYNTPAIELAVESGHLSEPLDPAPDDQLTRNDVTVSRPNGGAARSVQYTGDLNVNPPESDPQGVGTYPETPEINYGADSQLQAAADWRRSLGTQKVPRYPSFRMDLTASAYQDSEALTAQALTIDSGVVVNITNTRLAPDALPQLIQSYEETIDQFDHDITAVSTPAGLYTVGVSEYTTRMSPSGIVLASPFVVGTDTSLMTRPTGTHSPWVTTAADAAVAEFDIMVGGVRLHVNTITGTTVQTLNVDAAPINNVETGFTLQPGLPVTLAEPWVSAW